MTTEGLWFSQCNYCNHVIKNTLYYNQPGSCRAFPNGIPDRIWQNEISHNQPYPRDAGMLFSPKEDAEADLQERFELFIGVIQKTYGDINDPKVIKLVDSGPGSFGEELDDILELLEWVKTARKRESST